MQYNQPQPDDQAKFPVLFSLKKVVGYILRFKMPFLVLLCYWTGLALVVEYLMGFPTARHMVSAAPGYGDSASRAINPVLLFSYASLAVAFSRRIILKNSSIMRGFLFALRELHFMLRALGIAVLAFIVFAIVIAVFVFAAGMEIDSQAAGSMAFITSMGLVSLVIGGFILLVFARFLLSLTALSVGKSELTITQAWKITRGNTMRLGFGYAVVLLASSAISALFKALSGYVVLPMLPAGAPALTAYAGLFVFAGNVGVLLTSCYFAAAYMFFAYHRGDEVHTKDGSHLHPTVDEELLDTEAAELTVLQDAIENGEITPDEHGGYYDENGGYYDPNGEYHPPAD